MIDIKNASKAYGGREIYNNIRCTLQNGKMYALVGINGIGKTTLLNMITQSRETSAGSIYIDGVRNSDFTSKYRFFYISDKKDVFLNLSGREYLYFISQIYKQERLETLEKIEYLSGKFKIQSDLDYLICNYSLGMKQKLFCIGAFVSGAANLIMDEPFSGLDPEIMLITKSLLREYLNPDTMILYSAHNLDMISNFCDEIIFITKERQLLIERNPGSIDILEEIFKEECIIGGVAGENL